MTKGHEKKELPQWLDCMMKGKAVPGDTRMYRSNGSDGGDGEDDWQQLCLMTGEAWGTITISYCCRFRCMRVGDAI